MPQLFRSPVLRVLLALAAGLALGLLAPDSRAITLIEPVGQLWVSALRMTVVPLIVALLVCAVAGGTDDGRAIGKLGVRAFAWFIGLSVIAAVAGGVITPHLWTGLALDPAATAALRATTAALPVGGALTVRDWILALVPTNTVKAAADGAILPLLVFTLVFAAALARLPAATRAPVTGFFNGLGAAMLVVVGWVMALAPFGVFSLAAVVGAKLGSGAAAAIALFFVWSAVLYLGLTLALYPLALLGGIGPGRFARALLPAQAVAFASRSSFASLPAMIAAARGPLAIPEHVGSFVLPLAAATFKVQSGIGAVFGATFIAALYGIDLSPAQVAFASGYGVLIALTTPGVTSAGLLMQVPLYAALGLPIEGLGLLVAIDTVPDIFKTVANVTADLAVAVVVARGERDGDGARDTDGDGATAE